MQWFTNLLSNVSMEIGGVPVATAPRHTTSRFGSPDLHTKGQTCKGMQEVLYRRFNRRVF